MFSRARAGRFSASRPSHPRSHPLTLSNHADAICDHHPPDQDKISDFELKPWTSTPSTWRILDTEYAATVKMPSAEFQRICRRRCILHRRHGDHLREQGRREVLHRRRHRPGEHHVPPEHVRGQGGADHHRPAEPVTRTFALRKPRPSTVPSRRRRCEVLGDVQAHRANRSPSCSTAPKKTTSSSYYLARSRTRMASRRQEL